MGLLGGAEGFQEAEGHVAKRRVLPGQERHLLAEDRQVQGPVDEEQHATAVAGPRQVAEQQPGGQGESDERLHPLDPHDDALQPEAGARPLDEQALVLAANGPLCRMGAHRDQAEEGVEVEAAQGGDMAADAEVALLEERLSQQRQANRERGGQHGERRARRIEPGDADRWSGQARRWSAAVVRPGRAGAAACGRLWQRSAMSDVSRLWK